MSLSFDIACAKCNYFLRGLPYNGACPECATPIQASVVALHRQTVTPIKWLRIVTGVAVTRDLVWLALLLHDGGRIDGLLVCATLLSLFIEPTIFIGLTLAQPKWSRHLAWYSHKHGLIWCITSIFLALILIALCVAAIILGDSNNLFFALISSTFIIYLIVKSVAWIFPMRYARWESHHPDHPPAPPTLDLGHRTHDHAPHRRLGGLPLHRR